MSFPLSSSSLQTDTGMSLCALDLFRSRESFARPASFVISAIGCICRNSANAVRTSRSANWLYRPARSSSGITARPTSWYCRRLLRASSESPASLFRLRLSSLSSFSHLPLFSSLPVFSEVLQVPLPHRPEQSAACRGFSGSEKALFRKRHTTHEQDCSYQ